MDQTADAFQTQCICASLGKGDKSISREFMCAIVDAMCPPITKIVAIGIGGRSKLEYDVRKGAWTASAFINNLPNVRCMCNLNNTHLVVSTGRDVYKIDINTYLNVPTLITHDMHGVKMKNNCEFFTKPNSTLIAFGEDKILCLRVHAYVRFDREPYYGGIHAVLDLGTGTITILNHKLIGHGAQCTLLKNGNILISGSRVATQMHYTTCSFIFDAHRKWLFDAAPMNDVRWDHATCLLPNGRVFACGGRSGVSQMAKASITNTCEEYDPISGVWTQLPPMKHARQMHQCVLMSDGIVMIIGGAFIDGDCEFYDPATQTFVEAPTIPFEAHRFTTFTRTK